MTAETIDFIFDGLLKSLHDQKCNDGSGEANAYANDRDLMDRRRKTFPLFASYSFGYEIREVQIILTFSTGFHAK